jgi:2-dehydropantoate 2-reductase
VARDETILVAGAGALGSVIGGLLGRAGAEVTLLGRAAHLDAIARRGLEIDGLFGTHRVSGLTCASDAHRLAGPYTVVLLTVKAYDTEAMATAIAPHLAANGLLVSLQNGLGNLESCAAAVGRKRVLGGRVIFGAELRAPGQVRVTVYAAPVLIGSPDASDSDGRAAAEGFAARLARAGVPAVPSDDIVAELWAKVLYNAALNPLGALLGLTYGELTTDPDARALMNAAIDEAFAVARAAGVRLPWPDAAAYREHFYGQLIPPTAGHRSSMLQDIERGRPTEIEAISGQIVARGLALGVPAPTNDLLARLVRARARRTGGTEETRWTP